MISRARHSLHLMLWGLLFNVSPVAASDSGLANAISMFNAGRYEQALTLLSSAKYDGQSAGEAHYYKACSLAKLGRHEEAAREFKLAKLLDRKGNVAPLATLALGKYGEAPLSSPTSTGQTPAETITGNKPPVDPPDVKSAVKQISSQAEERIARAWSERDLAEKLRGRRRFYCGGMVTCPAAGAPRPRPVYVGAVGPHGTASPKQSAKNVADSATGLISQMTRKDDGKGVYLVPQGTNLYVRNYEYGQSIDPVLVPLKTDMKMESMESAKPQN